MEFKTTDLIHLGQYTIDTIEDPENEIDIKPEIINSLKKEITFTKRFIGAIPQGHAELENIVSYFARQREIVDEVVKRPYVKPDIEFTVKFIASNQRRINSILTSGAAEPI